MKTDDVRINDPRYDRRRKLSDDQREEILKAKGLMSVRGCAMKYGVSRRTIQFMWYPERKEKVAQHLANAGGQGIYYSRSRHAARMDKHRKYKRRLAQRKLINLPVDSLYHNYEYVWPFGKTQKERLERWGKPGKRNGTVVPK